MASEMVASVGCGDIMRETDLGNDLGNNLAIGVNSDFRCFVFPKYARGNLATYGYTGMFRVPLNLTMGTGLTFKIYTTDDGTNAGDLGLVVVFGLILKRLTTASTLSLESGAATEVTGNVTLQATTNEITIGSVVIANANLPASLAVGDLVGWRLRRVGTSASDTVLGKVLVPRVEINNT
jgi:hypothetical protein